MSTFRVERIRDLLLSFLAEEVRRLTDPRLAFVTLTDVTLSRDLKIAQVYWSIPVLAEDDSPVPNTSPESAIDSDSEGSSDGSVLFPSEKRQKEVSKALEKVEKHLKRRIADELDLRYVPKLNFHYDETQARGSRIEFLLKKAGF